MATFRRRFEEVQEADASRNKLIEDLLNKVDDMEKTMDRNAFVLVLIDGDGMNFNDDLIKRGTAGGEEASQRLRREVFNELRNSPDFRHDSRIVIKLYANMRGLAKLYTQYGLLSKVEDFSDFILGFNKNHPLCDAIDSGNHKESADKKIQETLNLHVHNVHCRHIIFGASADNSYASFLGSFHDIDIASRIRLLEGPPFAAEFKTILPRFKQLKFPEIFRSTKIDITQRNHFSPMKKPDVDLLKRKVDAPRFATDTNVVSPAIIERLINPKSQKPPPLPPQRIIKALPDRTNHPSPPKPKINISDRPISPTKLKTSIFDRPASPTKTVSDTGSGGVSLNPRQPSFEDALLRASIEVRSAARLANVPTTERVEKALIKSTLETLLENPRACDFANVKRRAEQTLNVDAKIWGSSEEDFWFSRSKRLIKWTVEQWLEVTNNALPGNATWLFKHFPTGKSTSSVLQKPSALEWRTPGESGWWTIFEKVAKNLDIA